jgi:hypothetical protein
LRCYQPVKRLAPALRAARATNGTADLIAVMAYRKQQVQYVQPRPAKVLRAEVAIHQLHLELPDTPPKQSIQIDLKTEAIAG